MRRPPKPSPKSCDRRGNAPTPARRDDWTPPNRDIVAGLTWLHLAQLAGTEAAAPEEYGDLTVEPWPHTLVIGNSYRREPDHDFEALSRAAALRRSLAAMDALIARGIAAWRVTIETRAAPDWPAE